MSLNAFSGIWNRDERPVEAKALTAATFRSPLWEPDRQGLETFGPIGFATTERFIAPEDSRDPMPARDAAGGCVVVADSYLLYREELASALGADPGRSDAALLLAAWRKWGEDCPRHLLGEFSFVIWDSSAGKLFAAIDRNGKRPLFYTQGADRSFVFANTMQSVFTLRPGLTLNPDALAAFTLDAPDIRETCYREVFKLQPGHTLSVTRDATHTRRYWRFVRERAKPPHRTREGYYAAFREVFSGAVRECLRTELPVSAHISGGLDSSTVASEAARQLTARNRRLHGFTAIPHALEGPGHNPGWKYHELPLVESVHAQYPNIDPVVYRTDPAADALSDLATYHPYTDQPFRNVSNIQWILASMRHINAQGGRVVLHGGGGNATLSWKGQPPRETLSVLRSAVRVWFRPAGLFNGYYKRHRAEFLRSPQAKRALRRRGVILDMQAALIERRALGGLQSSIRSLALWTGVEYLDPTSDPKVVAFCAKAPQWIYATGPGKLERRLLAREAMVGIVPEAILKNPFRGSQSADWHLQYNAHRHAWRARLENLGPVAAAMLWSWYDRSAMLALFDRYDGIESPSREADRDVHMNLMRCLSAAFYLDYLERRAS